MADNYNYYIKRQNEAPKIPCGCGCGEMIPSISRRGAPMKFKNGHGQRGENHSQWNGGRYQHKGYWYVWKPEHHFADKKGYVLEHRLVYEEHYNVCLLPWCDIHHINEQRDDNRIENLQAIGTRSEHMKHHKQQTDHSNTICLLCDSPYTNLKPDGRPHWYKFENGYICARCYGKNYDFYHRNKIQ